MGSEWPLAKQKMSKLIFCVAWIRFVVLINASDAICSSKKGPDDTDFADCDCYQEDNSTYFIDCHGQKMESCPFWDEQDIWSENFFNLDLSYNSIQELPRFSQMKVWSLDVSHNRLSSIKPAAFQHFANSLLTLDLSENKIDVTGLGEHGFKGITINDTKVAFALKELSLAGNRLHTVREGTFAYLTNLTSLNLADNPLAPMTQELVKEIQTLHLLQELNLRSTSLRFLPENILTGLSELQFIDLSGNFFTQVDPQLAKAPQLVSLNLDDNYLHTLTADSFMGLNNLKNLSVSHCPNLKTIGVNTFQNLTQLEQLRISKNKQLSWISPDAWPTSKEESLALKELDLSENHLRYLPSVLLHDFSDWKSIQAISLKGNVWMCDCHNEWMIYNLVPWIYSMNEQLTLDVVCHGPVGSSLVQMDMEVVSQLTNATDLPCDEQKFDPWMFDFNMKENIHRSSKNYLRSRRSKSLSNVMTAICVIAVLATLSVVGLLYWKKNEGMIRRRVPVESGGRKTLGYVLAGSSAPNCQAQQGDENNRPTGIHNQQYIPDQEEHPETNRPPVPSSSRFGRDADVY